MSFSPANDAVHVRPSVQNPASAEAACRAVAQAGIDILGVLRATARGVGLLSVFAAAAIHFGLTVPFLRKQDRWRTRALWLQRLSRLCARVIGLRIEQHGQAPASGMIVSNHLSYLDVLTFSATTPCVFVAKQEVGGWPLIGFFARIGGTIFVNRARRMQVAETSACIENALHAGVAVLLFAEGTSSDGRTVLPFRPALLEPMIKTRSPATPAAVAYSITAGSVAEEVCYWRDMTLLPHLLNLLTKPSVHARVGFAPKFEGFSSRKSSAAALRAEVVRLQRALSRDGRSRNSTNAGG